MIQIQPGRVKADTCAITAINLYAINEVQDTERLNIQFYGELFYGNGSRRNTGSHGNGVQVGRVHSEEIFD